MEKAGEFSFYLRSNIFDTICRNQSGFFSNDAEKASGGACSLTDINELEGIMIEGIEEPSDESGLPTPHIAGNQSYALGFNEVGSPVFQVIQLPGEKYLLDIFFKGEIGKSEKWFNHDCSFLFVELPQSFPDKMRYAV